MPSYAPFPLQTSNNWRTFATTRQIGNFLNNGAVSCLSWGEDPVIVYIINPTSPLTLVACNRLLPATATSVSLYTKDLWYRFFSNYKPVLASDYKKNSFKYISLFSNYLVDFFINLFNPPLPGKAAIIGQWDNYLTTTSPNTSKALVGPSNPYSNMDTNLRAAPPPILTPAQELDLNLGEYLIKQLLTIRPYQNFWTIMDTLTGIMTYEIPTTSLANAGTPTLTERNLCRRTIIDDPGIVNINLGSFLIGGVNTDYVPNIEDYNSNWAYGSGQTLDYVTFNGASNPWYNRGYVKMIFSLLRKYYVAKGIQSSIGPYSVNPLSPPGSLSLLTSYFLAAGANFSNDFTAFIYYRFIFDLGIMPTTYGSLNSNCLLLPGASATQYAVFPNANLSAGAGSDSGTGLHFVQGLPTTAFSLNNFSGAHAGNLFFIWVDVNVGGYVTPGGIINGVLNPIASQAGYSYIKGFLAIFDSTNPTPNLVTSVLSMSNAIGCSWMEPSVTTWNSPAVPADGVGNGNLSSYTLYINMLSRAQAAIDTIIDALHTHLTPLRQQRDIYNSYQQLSSLYSSRSANYSTVSSAPNIQNDFNEAHNFPSQNALNKLEDLYTTTQQTMLSSGFSSKRAAIAAQAAQAQTDILKDYQAGAAGIQPVDSLAQAGFQQKLALRADLQAQIQQNITQANNNGKNSNDLITQLNQFMGTITDTQNKTLSTVTQ